MSLRYDAGMTQVDQKTVEVTEDAVGRLDVWLAATLSISRRQVRAALERGQVKVNDQLVGAADKGCLLAAGDRVVVIGETDEQCMHPLPDKQDLDIIAQGNDWLVVNKPPGMPVHPLEPDETGTLLNQVVAHYPQIIGVGEGGLRCGVVHRLDVDTSGVTAFALTQERWEQLREAFSEHRAEKIYRAIVSGRLRGSGKERVRLVVAEHRPALVKVVDKGGRWCSLSWRVLRCFPSEVGEVTALEIKLETGFLHQIRVTFAAMGHSVVGDNRYGGVAATRLMLHAQRLRVGPVTGEAALPEGF